MKLLLDTHVVLWWTHDAQRLGDAAQAALADPRHDILLSAVLAWQITTKRALGKLQVRSGLISELIRDGARPDGVLRAWEVVVRRREAR